jgi:cyclohexadieny/prephenate dehydrogenase
MTSPVAPAPLFDSVCLIGLGLIGSSLSHAIRRAGLAREIVGYAKTPATRAKALELGLVTRAPATAAEAVAGCDLVILNTPVGACGAIAAEIGPHLAKWAIVTDVGGVKAAIVRDVAPHLPPHAHFVPGHPIAGTEFSGPESGFAELYDGKWTILTPPEDTDPHAIGKVQALWEGCGAKVEIMTPDHHDMVLAITSHVPHLIAYTIVGTADELGSVTEKEVIKFSAGGFRDFTRIAASDPVMWRDVFLNNREAVLEMLGRFNEDLSQLQRLVRYGDGPGMEAFFARTREIRRSVVQAGQDSATGTALYRARSAKPPE